MFYSQLLLAKKGALGKVWLAAHYDKRLTKAQIANTDIKALVASVAKPQTALSLRVSAHLLLGLSKIFQKQVAFLFVETSEALGKLRAVSDVTAHNTVVLAFYDSRCLNFCLHPFCSLLDAFFVPCVRRRSELEELLHCLLLAQTAELTSMRQMRACAATVPSTWAALRAARPALVAAAWTWR